MCIRDSGRTEAARGIGSGLGEVDAGLRLRYEIRREFAPYIGIERANRFGKTADFARAAGDEAHEMCIRDSSIGTASCCRPTWTACRA